MNVDKAARKEKQRAKKQAKIEKIEATLQKVEKKLVIYEKALANDKDGISPQEQKQLNKLHRTIANIRKKLIRKGWTEKDNSQTDMNPALQTEINELVTKIKQLIAQINIKKS